MNNVILPKWINNTGHGKVLVLLIENFFSKVLSMRDIPADLWGIISYLQICTLDGPRIILRVLPQHNIWPVAFLVAGWFLSLSIEIHNILNMQNCNEDTFKVVCLMKISSMPICVIKWVLGYFSRWPRRH